MKKVTKIKLLTVIGARPQFMKSAMLSKQIDLFENFSEILVNTGQHYDKSMSTSFISELFSRRPKYTLKAGGKDEVSMIVFIMEKLKLIILKEKPNYVVVFGDTTSALAASITAKKLKLPLIHVESGVRNYDNHMPEENNRVIIDSISDINFCPTNQSLKNLKNESLNLKKTKNRIIYSGDLMLDSFNYHSSYISRKSSILTRYKYLARNKFIYCTIHRQSNVDNRTSLYNIVNAINKIHLKIPIILPLHHRTRLRLNQFKLKFKCYIIDPVTYLESLDLLMNCKYVFTDSGGLIRESFFAKKKSLFILDNLVWPEVQNLNTSLNSGPDLEKIIKNFKKLSLLKPNFNKKVFGDGLAAKKILSEIYFHFND